MNDEPRERWLELCELAEKERDPAKLLALVSEINRLLEHKRGTSSSETREPSAGGNTRLPATSQPELDLYISLQTA